MHRKLLSVAVALTLAAAPFHASAAPIRAGAGAMPAADATTQLPRGVIPTHYQIELTPDAGAASFGARAVVTINVARATSTITLNAADLTFSKVTLAPAAGGAERDASVAVDNDAQTATFTFAQPVAPGMYRLAMDYTGVIGTQAVGLFSLDYPARTASSSAPCTRSSRTRTRAA
jgi:aminopeptidase N